MKKIILIILLVLTFLLVSCDFSPVDLPYKCYQTVEKEFPINSRIMNIPRGNYIFIVKTPEGKIWYAETMERNSSKITYKVQLFD